MHELVGLQLFWSRTPTFSSGTPTFCEMGVLDSCFQNPSESSAADLDLHCVQEKPADQDPYCLQELIYIWFHTVLQRSQLIRIHTAFKN